MEGFQDDWELKYDLQMRQAKGTGLVQLGEEMASGGPKSTLITLVEKREPASLPS